MMVVTVGVTKSRFCRCRKIRRDRNHHSMDDNDPNYLIWFLVIFFAVTLGNLASNYITAKIAEYHLMTAAGEADF